MICQPFTECLRGRSRYRLLEWACDDTRTFNEIRQHSMTSTLDERDEGYPRPMWLPYTLRQLSMSVYEVLSIYAKLTKLRRSLQRRIRRRHPFLSLSTKLNLCIESRYCWKDYWKDVHRYVCHAFRDDHYPVRGCPRLSNGGGPLTHTPLATTASPTENPNPNNQPETQLHSPCLYVATVLGSVSPSCRHERGKAIGCVSAEPPELDVLWEWLGRASRTSSFA